MAVASLRRIAFQFFICMSGSSSLEIALELVWSERQFNSGGACKASPYALQIAANSFTSMTVPSVLCLGSCFRATAQ
eukprot:4359307-Amphidinium_carterae.1